MTDSPDRFKTTARELALRHTATHQEGATWNIVPFSPAAHKHTDSASRRCGRTRDSAGVSPRATQPCQPRRTPR